VLNIKCKTDSINRAVAMVCFLASAKAHTKFCS
jgi:hypothetical protein